MKKAIQWTRGERIAGWSVLGGVVAIACLALWATLTERGPIELETGSDLVLPLAKLKANKLFLFRYRIDSSTLAPVAVQRGQDGIIRAAFSTCRRCFRSGSYEWSTQLICGHCRHVMKMPDPKLMTEAAKSGCALPSLEYSLEADALFVRATTMQSEFSKQFGFRQ